MRSCNSSHDPRLAERIIRTSTTATERRDQLRQEADERLSAAAGSQADELVWMLDRLADALEVAARDCGRGPFDDRLHRLSWLVDEALACRLDQRTHERRSRRETVPHFPTWSDALVGYGF